METNYQKLYAYLVGQVDDVLQRIAGDLMRADAGRKEIMDIGNQLKEALLTAEDMYLEESEQ